MLFLSVFLHLEQNLIQIAHSLPPTFRIFAETFVTLMIHQEEISLKSLTEHEGIQISYSDNDIALVDSIQKFAELNAAHIAMNAIVFCTNGIVKANMGNKVMELRKNQISVVPQNVIITDIMVSPDFDIKALFFTGEILHNSLLEKMSLWNDFMYVQRQHIITLEDDEFLFYTSFFDMLSSAIKRQQDNPYSAEVIRALLRAAILALCGGMKQLNHANDNGGVAPSANSHFQRFLNLLHNSEVKYQPVEAYASELCISPKYLTAICKKHSGKTATDWIREQVLEEIRYYLKQTDLSIKQVCDRIGFSNPSFFGKYVRQHLGMTPIEFRNS